MRSTGLLWAVRLALVGLAAVVLGGCIPAPATRQAQATAWLYWVFVGAAVVVAAIVWGLISWSIVRHRRRSDDLPVQTHGNLALEVIWTTLPILTVLALFGLTLVTLGQVDARSPERGVEIRVTAFQWQWRFDYPGARVTVTGQLGAPATMVVPVGVPVHITLVSNDVDHAFWVPAFLFKRDAIPGHPNTFDFDVTTAGTYGGQCAEFCGLYHDQMLLSVKAVSVAEYQAWLATAPRTPAGEASSGPTPMSSPPSGSPTPVGSPAPSGSVP